MEATKNIITTDSEFINATSRLDDIQRKFEDVSPIWKSGKLRSEMTDKEIKILSEYENMMDCETIGIKVGDKVAYRLNDDDEIYSGTVIDILDRGDIRTDTDGVLCAGQYAKINATPSETPQISTETAETVNVSAEGESAEKTTEIKPMCETTCDERPTLDDHDYYTWLWMRDYESEEFPELASENRYLSEGWMIYLDNQHRDWRTDITPQSPETPQMGECTAEQPEPRETAEIKITSITQLNVLKYKLQHPKLKEWAVKYGLLDLVRNMYYAPELSLGGLWIDNKFRQSLCENDKAIINAVRKLIADAEKAA